jgi:hypothetical protein
MADVDVCIHLEVVDDRYFGKKNVLVPNQEWFMRRWLKRLNKFDAILCKSRYAYEIFKNYHKNVKYTSFTSIDCYIECNKVIECFHASGKSTAKGTHYLKNIWETNRYPPIHIVSKHLESLAVNSDCILTYPFLQEKEFNFLRNKFLIHIYPSQVEGFGHIINEAKSCGAIVITTDYPPMNELIDNFLIPIQEDYFLPDKLGKAVTLNTMDIQSVLNNVFLCDDLSELGMDNRRSFLQNDLRFRQNFLAALNEL